MAKPETLAAIKAKFPKVVLSKKRLDAIADKIEAKVTDENTLDAAIDTFNEYNPLEDIQKSDDRLRTAEEKLKLAKNPPKKEDETVTEDPITDPEMPAWAKVLVDQNKKLETQLTTLQAEKAQGSIRQTVTEKLKDVPVSYWGKRALPEKAEDLDAFVTEVTADYDGFIKEQTDLGVRMIPRPQSGAGGNQNPGSKTVSPEVKAYMDRQNAAKPAAPVQAGALPSPKFINTPAPL